MGNILVTGATGLLGCALTPVLKQHGHQVIRAGRTRESDVNFDLTSYEETARTLDQAKPEVIVNLAALTDVDRCENHPHEAYLLNVKTVKNLCNWIRKKGRACHLIHISTDQLYNGTGPHEEGNVSVCNHYAMSKLAAEFVGATVGCTTLRVNFVGRSGCSGRLSLTDWLYNALRTESSVNVFSDVLFSPLAISTLCSCIERCALERPVGVFNLGSRDGLSKADFAFAFAAHLGFQTKNLRRVSLRSSKDLLACRPTDMRMISERFEHRMSLKLPRLADEIELIAKHYQNREWNE